MVLTADKLQNVTLLLASLLIACSLMNQCTEKLIHSLLTAILTELEAWRNNFINLGHAIKVP
jgi:hypothetical protein